MDAAFLAFAGLALLLTVTPGADMAYVTATTLRHGRRVAWVASLGVVSGLAVHATLSALGVSLLATSAQAFRLLQLAGGAYLAGLGLWTLWGTVRGAPAKAAPAPAPPRGSAFLRGLLVNLLNPKVAVFYLAVLPQFVQPGQNVLARSLLLAGVHIGWGLLWLPMYAWMVERLGQALGGASVRTWLGRATGAALLALGLRLALDPSPGVTAQG